MRNGYHFFLLFSLCSLSNLSIERTLLILAFLKGVWQRCCVSYWVDSSFFAVEPPSVSSLTMIIGFFSGVSDLVANDELVQKDRRCGLKTSCLWCRILSALVQQQASDGEAFQLSIQQQSLHFASTQALHLQSSHWRYCRLVKSWSRDLGCFGFDFAYTNQYKLSQISQIFNSLTSQKYYKYKQVKKQLFQLKILFILKIDSSLVLSNVVFFIYKFQMKAINLPIIIILISALIISMKSSFVVKRYPLGQDYFQKIYIIYHNGGQYYLTITCKDRNMLSISIAPQKDFVQSPTYNIYGSQSLKPNMTKDNYTFLKQCHVAVQVNSSNYIEVKRQENSQTIFVLGDISLKPNHNQFTIYDESLKWGLGERFQRHFHVVDGRWTIWNKDKPWKIDEGKLTLSDQTYSHHPIYLARQKQSKLYHLTYFKNTHGLTIQSYKNSSQMVYHSIGGNIHFVIFLGSQDPEQLIQRYHQYIGLSHIAPFWSFGHHQCRWGYKSLSDIQEVVKKYNQNDIPLDTMWSDLQYMKNKRIFTVNQNTHPPKKMNQFFKSEELNFVPLLDVGISVDDLEAVKEGKKLNVFFKNPKDTISEYVGEVWPGKVYYIDFLHPNSSQFWKNQLNRLYSRLNFSGIWLDMNQPTNFKGGQPISPQNEPYKIQISQNLNALTINTELQHYNQRNPHQSLKHREVHAYYGHLSTVPTFQFLSQYRRPFIISRSTSIGSGIFAGHWTGDNVATWDFLRLSISGNFLFQIFGIQMVGADICGFYRSTTEQLCSRWHQIGAFYPFSRNHNHHQARSQQPYSFGNMLLQASRDSLKTRYALLKQLFTIYLSKKGKGSYYRPLIFQFYDDEFTFQQETIQTQILIGKFLMTAPIVYQGYYQREVYFPGNNQQWYKFQLNSNTGKVNHEKVGNYLSRTKQIFKNPIQSAPLTFLRGGYMIFTNYPQNRSVKLSNQFNIFATLKQNKSKGTILGISNYNQQAEIKKCIDKSCILQLKFTKTGYQTFKLEWNYQGEQNSMIFLKIKSILIAGSNKKWKSDDSYIIDSPKGQLQLKVPQII